MRKDILVRGARLWLILGGLTLFFTACSRSGKAIQQLRLGSTEERVQAAQELGEMGGEEAVEALVAALSDPIPEVQIAAAEALGKLGAQAGGELWIDLKEGSVRAVIDATTFRYDLTGTQPQDEDLAGMTLEFSSGPRTGERYSIETTNGLDLTVAEDVDFQEEGKDITGSTFKIGRPVSEALIAVLAGSLWTNEAVHAFEEAIDTGGPTADIHLTLARLYQKQGRKEKAVESLNEALELTDNPGMYVSVAREFNKLELRDQTLKTLGRAAILVEENPNGYTYIDIAREYANLGEEEKARRLLAKAEALAVTQTYLYSSLAGVYDRLGDPEKAKEARAKAGPAPPGAGFHLPGGTFQVP